MLVKLLVCFFAGMGAGIGTGFAGMSAAAVVGPLLITFLDVPAYEAVGIGLASDVLASLVSAYTYKKNDNLDIKHGSIMMVFVILFTVFGSYIATHMPNPAMSGTVIVALLLLGLRFIIKPVATTKEDMLKRSDKQKLVGSIVGGILVGFICGFVGAGGGMMMLFVLTSFLGYEIHTAVGTSVFIMAFTALTGSVSHFLMGDMPNLEILIFCIAFTFIWARIASKIANKASLKTLNRIVGIVLVITSGVIILVNAL